MHCLTMQHNRMLVTSCHTQGFVIFWLKMWRKMLALKAGIFHCILKQNSQENRNAVPYLSSFH